MEDFNQLDPQLPDPTDPNGGFNNLLDPNLNYGKPGAPDMPVIDPNFADEVASKGLHTDLGYQMRQEFDY